MPQTLPHHMTQMETFMTLYLPKYTSANQPANTNNAAVTTPSTISKYNFPPRDCDITFAFIFAERQAHASKFHTTTRITPLVLSLLARYPGRQRHNGMEVVASWSCGHTLSASLRVFALSVCRTEFVAIYATTVQIMIEPRTPHPFTYRRVWPATRD